MTLKSNGIARMTCGIRAAVLAGLMLLSPWGQAAEGHWFKQGRPAPIAQAAVQVLERAADEGLNPADYDADGLAKRVAQAAAPSSLPLSVNAQTALSDALAAAMRRYLHDLHYGRVDPASVYANFKLPPKTLNVAAALEAAVAAGNLAPAIHAATPQFPLYQALRPWLVRYRTLESDPAWVGTLPPLPATKLEPGAHYAGVPKLAARLVSLGDLPKDFVVPDHYQGPLVDGVKLFQKRHGLTPDGVIGKGTFEQLNTSPAARVEQIALTMERLRWTPLRQAPRMVVVNLPEFVLRAYELQPDGRIVVRARMKVIVGRALDTRTPLFDELMRAIEFSPFWNVPPSIARKELVPRLRRDPGYFDREGFEFVDPTGQVLATLGPARLDAVMAGTLRIRQRPGPRNALGDIKFVFPNRDGIYLHHTPATALFERDRRDFSHGCIRVEQPVELARFVLEGEAGWDEARIRQAMAAGTSTTLRLARPLPVLIAYGTALVRDGRLHFFDDVYGHDRLLDAALRQRQRPSLPTP